jgi:hypothetical protein
MLGFCITPEIFQIELREPQPNPIPHPELHDEPQNTMFEEYPLFNVQPLPNLYDSMWHA